VAAEAIEQTEHVVHDEFSLAAVDELNGASILQVNARNHHTEPLEFLSQFTYQNVAAEAAPIASESFVAPAFRRAGWIHAHARLKASATDKAH
jgi:hypothetical protein